MNPITHHIRGNARLRRKIDAQAAQLADIERAIGPLLVLADKHGFGDHPAAVAAAKLIGWVRMTAAEREEVARKIREAGAP